jgi:hypothetical protein
VAAFAVVLLAASACSSGKAATPTTQRKSPLTTAATTPTTPVTAAPPPVAPLTGLPQPDPARLNRVALAVKIDNVDPARPQAGLGAADVVYEEMVEDGLTRLIAVFQSTDAARVGPVRSTRTTDLDVVAPLNHPLYAYSGGNPSYVAQLRAGPVTDVGADADGGAYFRSGPHAQPHNLYTSTPALFRAATGTPHPPGPLFTYRAAAQPLDNPAVPASHLALSFPMAAVGWDWDAAAQVWKRSQNGSADVDETGQLTAANVIVQLIPYVTDGYAVGEGISPPPPIPKGQSVGSGTALVLTGGGVINANWTKTSSAAATVFTDSTGKPIALAPGRTWVELAPVGTAPSVH